MMAVLLCILIALLIVAMVTLVAVFGWSEHHGRAERSSLCAIAAGLIWAAPSWFLAHRPPGLGDILFLGGVAGLMAILYGRAIRRRVDHPGLVTWLR